MKDVIQCSVCGFSSVVKEFVLPEIGGVIATDDLDNDFEEVEGGLVYKCPNCGNTGKARQTYTLLPEGK